MIYGIFDAQIFLIILYYLKISYSSLALDYHPHFETIKRLVSGIDESFYHLQGTEDTMMTLLWAVFDPGHPEAIPECDEGPILYTSFILWYMYLFLVFIILLNLLIALFSESIFTLNEFSWKFERSRVWLDYCHSNAILPAPFNLFSLITCFLIPYAFLRNVDTSENHHAYQGLVRNLKKKYEKDLDQDDANHLMTLEMSNIIKTLEKLHTPRDFPTPPPPLPTVLQDQHDQRNLPSPPPQSHPAKSELSDKNDFPEHSNNDYMLDSFGDNHNGKEVRFI